MASSAPNENEATHRLNVLVLHNLERFAAAPRSALDHLLCFSRYARAHNFLHHRILFPVTPTIRNTPWDVVIFDPTAVAIATIRPRERFEQEKAKWSFLSGSGALLVVMPQDDANHGWVMDRWFSELKAHALFTVRPEFSELIYPRTIAQAKVVRVLSGYLDDHSLPKLAACSKPFESRTKVIGQRISLYPPRGGRHSRIKGQVAELLKRAAQQRGIVADISTDPNDFIYGDDWYRFLGDCRFVVGAEGGMSLFDPEGDIYDRIEAFTKERPNASFEEIEATCFPGQDGQQIFSGFNPRTLEAAACGCCQILVEAEWLGLLKPFEHYIPIRPDGSNLDEVFDAMANEPAVNNMIRTTHEVLVENPQLRYSHFVRQMFEFVAVQGRTAPTRLIAKDDFRQLKTRHAHEMVKLLLEQESRVGFEGHMVSERVVELIRDQGLEWSEELPMAEGSSGSHRASEQRSSASLLESWKVVQEERIGLFEERIGLLEQALGLLEQAADQLADTNRELTQKKRDLELFKDMMHGLGLSDERLAVLQKENGLKVRLARRLVRIGLGMVDAQRRST